MTRRSGSTGANQPWNTNLSGDGTGGTFNDSATANWLPGDAELDYGDGDEDKVISFGPSSSNKCISYYFRREFEVSDPTLFDSLSVLLLRDDGAIVYINGTQVVRSNLTSGTVTSKTRGVLHGGRRRRGRVPLVHRDRQRPRPRSQPDRRTAAKTRSASCSGTSPP